MRSSCSSSPSTIIWVSADQQVQHVEIALAQRHLEGLHVEPVARQHRSMVAPLHVGRGPPAARARIVDHVVVHQRGGMDHLDHRAQLDGAAAVRPPTSFEASSSSAGRSRLPPLCLQILADLGDGFHRRHGSRLISFSTRSRSSWIRSKISLRGEGLPELAQIHWKYQCNR